MSKWTEIWSIFYIISNKFAYFSEGIWRIDYILIHSKWNHYNRMSNPMFCMKFNESNSESWFLWQMCFDSQFFFTVTWLAVVKQVQIQVKVKTF